MLLLILVVLLCIFLKNQNPKGITPDFVLTYGENHRLDYPTTKGALKFAELVEIRTNGKVKIQVKYNGKFGTGEKLIEQLEMGSIDFAGISISTISDELPRLNVLQLPFLYKDSEHMWRVLDGEIGTSFLKEFEQLDLVAMSWHDAGARSFYSAGKAIRSVNDLVGMKVRVQDSDMMKEMVTLFGGIADTTAFSEVYSGFETSEIDVAENNLPSYMLWNHANVAKYYTVDEHTRVPEVQLASGKTWKKLPKEYRTIILECAKESAEYQRALWEEVEASSKQEAIASGCEIIYLSSEELQKFRDIVTPLYEKYCAEYLELVAKIKE